MVLYIEEINLNLIRFAYGLQVPTESLGLIQQFWIHVLDIYYM